MTRTTAQRPKDRKHTIVEAAADLFATRGFAAVGIDDIGARVGVTGPAIYRHYRSKDAVLVAVLERTATALADAVDTVGVEEGVGAIELFVRASVRLVLDQPAMAATYLRERARLSREEAQPFAGAERRVRRAWLAAMQSVHPELDDDRAAVRRGAVVAALATGARRHPDVGRPRLDDLLVASAVGMVTAPPAPRDRGPRESGWQAPASKRDEILHAALALFRARGVSGVGVDEIGAAAGISGPTLYHYFPSKAEIVLDAYDRAGARVSAAIDESLRGAHSASDALDRLVTSYVAIAADSVDLIVVTSREAEALPAGERPRLARRRRATSDAWVAALREVRHDLTEPEARLLVRCVYPVVNHAVEAAEGMQGMEGEIVALANAHLRAK